MSLSILTYKPIAIATRYMLLLLLSIYSLTIYANQFSFDDDFPLMAGPVEFNVVLVDEDSVEFSWNSELIDGTPVSYYNIWNANTLLNTTEDNSWRYNGVDRNDHYDFSVSAVTESGEETRRSDRVYYDLAQLDQSTPDQWNSYLPPLEMLNAEIIDDDTVRLSWAKPAAHWSWADPADYEYSISIGGSRFGLTDDLTYTLSDMSEYGLVWISVSPFVDGQLYSRQPNLVLVDMDAPAGTTSNGYPGYNDLFDLRTDVYSSTAAELFWDVHGSAETAHVFFDGRLVARIEGGKSFFTDELMPGRRTLVSVAEAWPESSVSDNYRRLLYHDGPMMHAWIETPGEFGENRGNPEPVTGLKADVYSTTAAEIRWDRSDAVLARYRIYVNGEFLTETDAISWFFDGLTAGSQTLVGVSAIGPDEIEASIVEISFTTPPGYVTNPNACGVSGLHVNVYSPTATEIFWQRDNVGTQYELWLDGELLATTDAISWYSDEYEPGSSHKFAVKQNGASCELSESVVTFEQPGMVVEDPQPGLDAVINSQNYVELLGTVFGIYLGENYTDPLEEIAEFNIAGRNDDGTFFGVYECESGDYFQDLNPTSTNAGVFFTFDFNDCLFDGKRHDGYVSGQDGARGLNFTADSRVFSIDEVDTDKHADYSGYFQIWNTQTAFFDDIHSFDTSDAFIDLVNDSFNRLVQDMNTSFGYGNRSGGLDEAWMSGGFTAQLGGIDGDTITASIPLRFSYQLNIRQDGQSVGDVPPTDQTVSVEMRNNWTFTEGQLNLTGGDGSTLLLNADNGDPLTVNISITSDQETVTFTQPWSAWKDDLRFDRFRNLAR